jgi:serine/threonine-protein kinase
MALEAPGLQALLDSVADGRPVDWETLDSAALDAATRRTLRHLRMVAALSSFHRDLVEGPSAGLAEQETSPLLPELRRQMAAAARAAREELGQTLRKWGSYELLEKVGAGSYGEVYRARDPVLDREVAVKLLWPAAPGRVAERILHEGRMLARVKHANVVAVHAVETHGGQAGLAMEFVRGASLEELVRKSGPLSASEAALLGQDLCRALAAVHGAGLLHGDVKAHNVMRQEGGRVVLMDFGAGQFLTDAPETRPGTPLYTAPEVLQGGEASAKSDVYGLGVLLYFLVTGTHPLRAKTLEELREAVRRGARVRVQDARPDLPHPFARVVEKATALDAAERYDTAGALHADLGRALGFELASTPVQRTHDTAAPAVPAPVRTWPRRRLLGLAALLVAGLAGALVWTRGRPGRGGGGGGSGAPPMLLRSAAVLPFVNSQGDREREPIVNALTVDTTRRLQDFDLMVKGVDSASQMKDRAAPDILRQLKVEGYVRGVVAPARDGLEVYVELVRGPLGESLWSDVYEMDAESRGRVPGEIAAAIARKIGAERRGPATPAPNPEAYAAYHEGRMLSESRSREDLQAAIRHYERAARLDPGYAEPWTGIADAYSLLGGAAYGAMPPRQARARCTHAALKALAIRPDLAEAHASRAFLTFFFDWNWAEAERGFQRAIALNPNYALAHHWYADFLNAQGRQKEAMAELGRGAELDPLSAVFHRDYAWHYFHQRRFDEATRQLRETLQRRPGYTAAETLLARALLENGRPEEAIELLQKAVAKLPRGIGLAMLASAQAGAGQTGKARDTLARIPREARGDYVSPYFLALAHLRLGQREQTLQLLERGFAEGDTTMVSLKVDPRWDPIRREPRYRDLLTKMSFPP